MCFLFREHLRGLNQQLEAEEKKTALATDGSGNDSSARVHQVDLVVRATGFRYLL